MVDADGRERERDDDENIRSEAVRFIARRALIWFVPLTLIAFLLIGLGLPAWGVVVACLIAYAVAVFELDL